VSKLDGKLDGRIALVTGGGRGIGRGIVLELAGAGADAVINYRRDRDAAERTAAEVRALGRRATVLQADVGDREAVDRMMAEAIAAFGRLDIVVANSGVASRVAPVAETDPAEWRRVMTTDLDGAFWTARAAVPHLIASRGTIIFVSSIGADTAGAYGAPYHVAKAGVNALVKVLAKEVAGNGVRVNCIAPGLVRSDMGDRLLRVYGDAIVQGIPLGRPGEPVDVGRAAVFLASDDASWITGKILRVDGGAWM
jgi:3-oxoacyl-[acyl-carrier protein] reductase